MLLEYQIFNINVFIAIVCISVTCLAEENTTSPEREKLFREMARRIGIGHEKILKKSEKQTGRLLYLHDNHSLLRHTCDLSGEIWARVLKNKSELKEIGLLLQYCDDVDKAILSFRRKYEYADIAAEDEKIRKVINKMLREDINLVKSELAIYIKVIDILSKDYNSSYALSLSDDIKNHFINIDDDFNNLRLKGNPL